MISLEMYPVHQWYITVQEPLRGDRLEFSGELFQFIEAQWGLYVRELSFKGFQKLSNFAQKWYITVQEPLRGDQLEFSGEIFQLIEATSG